MWWSSVNAVSHTTYDDTTVILSTVCMLQHIQCQAVSKGTSAGYKPVHGCFLSCLILMFNLLTCSQPTDLG